MDVEGGTVMSDFRNSDYRNPDYPLRRDAPYDPDARAMNATWGWIAAAVFLVVVLAVAFGIGHQPGQFNTASNDTPPAAHMAPPPVTMAPNPAVTNPVVSPTPAPVTPTPKSNGQ
jgi:cell division protein FtsN